MAPSFFYLRPGAFNLIGFAYGKTERTNVRDGKVKVKLMLSGRWANEQIQTVDLELEDLLPRTVSEDEAMCGVGTFVGSVICTSRVRPGGARVWVYGLVTGYKWEPEKQQGWLDVNLSGAETSILYDLSSTEDVAVEVYALQPCGGQSTSVVMAAEMKMKHQRVYNKFNGVGQDAARDSKEILASVGSEMIDESKSVPLLDITSFQVIQVTIRHVLDFVFYKESGRTPPTGVVYGETIFDDAVDDNATAEQDPSIQAQEVLGDGLSDSDEDTVAPQARSRVVNSETRQTVKRRRLDPVVGNSTAPPVAQTSGLSGASQLDELILAQRNRMPTTNISRGNGDTPDTQQFHPTGMQTSIHLALVNGKYAQMTAQRFVEYVQIYWRKFGFFPHPAVLRSLYGWDFGTRGLSILHFSRVTESEKRNLVRGSDMSNFSRKNTLPAAPVPDTFSVLIGAVEVLCALTQPLYLPVVYDTLTTAAGFLGELRVSELPSTYQTLAEVAAWVDDRLELFRVLVAEEKWEELGKIKSHFSASHESFVRVHQMILRQEVFAAVKVVSTGNGRHTDNQTRSERNPEAAKRTFIPNDVRQATPRQGKKQICLRFLSAQGCRGKNGNCVIKHLCHFRPAALPEIVRDFIIKNYGGLASDIQ